MAELFRVLQLPVTLLSNEENSLFSKNIHIVNNTKSELIISELFLSVFYYINIFCKKLEYEIKPNFSKDRIRPPLVFFSAFFKEITTNGSSHFLSPNGQGSSDQEIQD